MAVLLEDDIFTFWCWILVIGRYAIMYRFGTRFLALTVGQKKLLMQFKWIPDDSNIISGRNHRRTVH